MVDAITHRQGQKPHITPLEGEVFGEILSKGISKLSLFFFGKILDVGCGDGYGSGLIPAGCEYVGVDLEPECVTKTSNRGVLAICAAQERLPFFDKSFDCYFSSHTLEHTYDLEATLKEMRRVARRAILIIPIDDPRGYLESHTHPFRDEEYVLSLFENDTVLFYEHMGDKIPEILLVIDFNDST